MKKRILVIEDEKDHLNVMRSKLELEGYIVLSAEDGVIGLRMIEEEKPDLVLLDVILPSMDGFEILAEMQKKNLTSPVIIVSNSGQPVEIDKGMALGAKDYLVKAEFNPADVIQKVHKQLKDTQPLKKEQNANNSSSSVSIANYVHNTETSLLIVEDDKFLRDLIVNKLSREGFTVHEAVDGETALSLLEGVTPQVILLDLLLPGIDGFEVLRQLQASKKYSSIPVIVLSNLGQQEDVDMARSLGARDFLIKAQYTPGEIITHIKKVLSEAYVN
jgi:DNA-binding response OmpR family regulator